MLNSIMSYSILMPATAVGITVIIGHYIVAYKKLSGTSVPDNTISLRNRQAALRRRMTDPISKFDREYEMNGVAYIPNSNFVTKLNSKSRDRECGVTILYAPPGSGKSTYLRKLAAAQILHMQRPTLLFDGREHSDESIVRTLDVNVDEEVSQIINGDSENPSLLIFDQFDQIQNVSNLDNFIRHLATDSQVYKTYNTIISVSDPTMYNHLLGLNGLDKIHPLCDPEELMWSETEIDAFILKECVDVVIPWSLESIEIFRNLALKAKNPIFMKNVAVEHRKKSEQPTVSSVNAYTKMANQYATAWKAHK